MLYTQIETVLGELERMLLAAGPDAEFIGLTALVLRAENDAQAITVMNPSVKATEYVPAMLEALKQPMRNETLAIRPRRRGIP